MAAANGQPGGARGTVLFVSHREKQCGVYQFGLNIGGTLRASTRYGFRYVECAGPEECHRVIRETAPVAVIYNHHPSTMPWISRRVVRQSRVLSIGVIHEITQAVADEADDLTFDFHVAPDPTLELRNPIVFKTGRFIPSFAGARADAGVAAAPAVPVIGSFGFGTEGKGFEDLIRRVQAEFDEAVIRLHIPSADFSDRDGAAARAIAARCQALITKPGIRLELRHDFLSNEELLAFLAGNSLNAFLYEQQKSGRGISSVTDYALAVGRPIAVSRSSMFRHLHGVRPPITVEDASLRDILTAGVAPLAPLVAAWTAENLVRDYEHAVDQALARANHSLLRRTELWLATSPRGEPILRALRKHPALKSAARSLRDWVRGRDRTGAAAK